MHGWGWSGRIVSRRQRPRLGRPRAAERQRLVAGLAGSPQRAARFLLGKYLVRRIGGRTFVARIVETEAYLGEGDPAAHAAHGRTRRNEPLWGPPGTVYVYFVYGMHHCLNIVASRAGKPGCVLIRAAAPVAGLTAGSCRGPGRLCRVLAIDTRDSGGHALAPTATLYLREGAPPRRVGVSVRVGIREAADRLLRFFDVDSRDVSALKNWRAHGATRRRRLPGR